jgi:hypothetical protein
MAEFVFYFSSRPSKIQASPAELHRTEIKRWGHPVLFSFANI